MNGLRNWYYRDIITFLKIFGFKFSYQKVGSHEVWMNDKKIKVELYNSTNKRPFPPGRLIKILTRTGIDLKMAKKWTGLSKKKKKKNILIS